MAMNNGLKLIWKEAVEGGVGEEVLNLRYYPCKTEGNNKILSIVCVQVEVQIGHLLTTN
jgi:hypothetical protein